MATTRARMCLCNGVWHLLRIVAHWTGWQIWAGEEAGEEIWAGEEIVMMMAVCYVWCML